MGELQDEEQGREVTSHSFTAGGGVPVMVV